MEDTTFEVKQEFYEILMSRPEEERFLMCAEMYDVARAIAFSTMPENLTEKEQKQFIYKKIYDESFPSDFPL